MRADMTCRGVGLLMMALAGCSGIDYSARPLDPDALVRSAAGRSAETDGLRQFATANGYDGNAWPPAEWGLRELGLTALYFHPDLRTARARSRVAKAESVYAPGAPLSVRARPEYHSRKLPEDDAPWTLGLELEIPLVSQGRRAARTERNAFLVDAADLDVAAAAWTVRARVRDAFIELRVAREALALSEAQVAARREMLALIERRMETGALSSREVGTERVLLAQAELRRDEDAARVQRGLGELAIATGLPVDVIAKMKLNLESRPPADAALDAPSLQRLALRNRLDVHRRLLEFGAADAEVKYAVASQNPEFQIGPGYAWDRGDNVWSLGVGMTFPTPARARADIRAAEARRELAAEEFASTQSGAIAATEVAGTRYRAARERMLSADRQLAVQRQQQARVERQFEAGAADRVERTTSRIEVLAAGTIAAAAAADGLRSLAHLEDAVQRPLFGDFSALPDIRQARASGEGKR
jgi:outer membrane protein TolC